MNKKCVGSVKQMFEHSKLHLQRDEGEKNKKMEHFSICILLTPCLNYDNALTIMGTFQYLKQD